MPDFGAFALPTYIEAVDKAVSLVARLGTVRTDSLAEQEGFELAVPLRRGCFSE